MATKTIYMVRHGETTSNLEQTWRTANEDLTERGIEQARLVGERIQKLSIDTMVASTSLRTMHTAEIISEVTGLSFEGDPLFYAEKEPTSIQGLRHEKNPDNPIEQYLQALIAHADDPDFHYEDEENLTERKVRVAKMLAKLESMDEESVLVVLNGNIVKLFAAYILLGPEASPKALYLTSEKFKTANTGITKIICDKGVWRILIWNDHAHFAE